MNKLLLNAFHSPWFNCPPLGGAYVAIMSSAKKYLRTLL